MGDYNHLLREPGTAIDQLSILDTDFLVRYGVIQYHARFYREAFHISFMYKVFFYQDVSWK